MVIEKRWIQTHFPGKYRMPQSDETGEGWILDSDYIASATGLRALGPVIFEPLREPAQAEWGWWCWQDGPSGELPVVHERRHVDVDAEGRRSVHVAQLRLGRRMDPRPLVARGARALDSPGADQQRRDPDAQRECPWP